MRYKYDKKIFNVNLLPFYIEFVNCLNDLNLLIDFNSNINKCDFYNIVAYYFNLNKEYLAIYNICMFLIDESSDNLYLLIRYVNSFMNKKSYCSKKVKEFLQKYNCSFITLTFDDKHLKYANDINIKRFLNKLNCDYIANVDYGAINNRKHYHAIITSQDIDLSLYKYGAINIKKIVVSNSKSLTSYLMKLSYHGFKETDKLIYSRKKRKKGV